MSYIEEIIFYKKIKDECDKCYNDGLDYNFYCYCENANNNFYKIKNKNNYNPFLLSNKIS